MAPAPIARSVFHPGYSPPLPPGHRFPMGKFAALAKLLADEGLSPAGLACPDPIDADILRQVHAGRYVDAILQADLDPASTRRIGLPVTPEVAMRARLAAGGTLLAARIALAHGIGFNLAGGSHHADAQGGAGFCVFNDVALAIAALRAVEGLSRVLVLDLDVHQGDGTARLFAQDRDVFTLSIHAGDNWPLQKAQSDLDIPLPSRTEDGAYLAVLREALQAGLAHGPQIVFYNAGIDPHRDDHLGKLALSDQGIAAREAMVLQEVRGAGLPICVVMGGGYQGDLARLAHLHAMVHRAGA